VPNIVFMYTPEQISMHVVRMILPENCSMELFDADCVYPSDTVFYYDMYGGYHDKIPQQLALGHKIIFDAKNEHYVHSHFFWVLYKFLQHPGQGCFVISGHCPDPLPGVEIIATPYWYWILDQMNFRLTKLDQQIRNPQITHKFFMSMSLQRTERDYLYDTLGPLLSQSIHSYRSRGVMLPSDNLDSPLWQRYVNPDWIDHTAFTLAVETYVNSTMTTGLSLTQHNHLFLCEKSYKPMAAQHPILMVSTQGNLAYLRSQGFETFPELFDESYDDIQDWQQRVQRIVEIVREFDVNSVNQPSVREKTQYNHARFFNQQLVKEFIEETIQKPLSKFLS
jgi:hypothetical protein